MTLAELLSLPRTTRFLFLATLFCVTFEKIHWNIAGSVGIADFVTIAFLLAYTLDRVAHGDGRWPRTSTRSGPRSPASSSATGRGR